MVAGVPASDPADANPPSTNHAQRPTAPPRPATSSTPGSLAILSGNILRCSIPTTTAAALTTARSPRRPPPHGADAPAAPPPPNRGRATVYAAPPRGLIRHIASHSGTGAAGRSSGY